MLPSGPDEIVLQDAKRRVGQDCAVGQRTVGLLLSWRTLEADENAGKTWYEAK